MLRKNHIIFGHVVTIRNFRNIMTQVNNGDIEMFGLSFFEIHFSERSTFDPSQHGFHLSVKTKYTAS